ncbi:MAG: hypothetical protein ACOYOJ_22725, partial [Alsobacter sp.]
MPILIANKRVRRLLACVALAGGLLVGCGGGGDTPITTPTPAVPGVATLDSEGGIVAGQDGATLTVPRGAINRLTTLTIARDSNDAPARPPEYPLAGNVYAVTPHGTTFVQPATVRVPFDRSMLATGERVALLKAELNGSWELIDDVTVDGDHVVARIGSLSFLAPVRRLGQVTYTPNPPPTEAQISLDIDNSTFNTLVAAPGAGVRFRQQDSPTIPANIRVSVNIPATSSLWQNGPCNTRFGFTFGLLYSAVSLYRVPGETGTRVWRPSSTPNIFMSESTFTSVGTYYNDGEGTIGRTLTFSRTFNPVQEADEFPYGGPPPSGTISDGRAYMIQLTMSCNNGVIYPLPVTASPIVITQGFPDAPFQFFRLPGPLVAAEGQAVSTSAWGISIAQPRLWD